MPAFIDVPETRTDFEAVKAIRYFFTKLQRLTEALDDSMLLAGSEAYISTLSVYKVLKNAAAMGQPGAEEAVSELAARFPKGKRNAPPE